MKKPFILISSTAILFFALPASAVCPICTIAVGAGVGIAEEFGIDDVVIGLWIGGLTISLIFWTLDWLKKKKIISVWAGPLTIFFYFVAVIVPLFFMKSNGYPIIGKELNKFWGIDKILLGILIGSILFFSGARLYEYLKKRNNGRAYFPFQKVAMPIVPLIIASIIFYYLTK